MNRTVFGAVFRTDNPHHVQIHATVIKGFLISRIIVHICKGAVLLGNIIIASRNELKGFSTKALVIVGDGFWLLVGFKSIENGIIIVFADEPQLIEHVALNAVLFVEHQHHLVGSLWPCAVNHIVAVGYHLANARAIG